MELLLIRPGRAACTSPRGLIDRGGIERWRVAYDQAGLREDEWPPGSLMSAVRNARVVAASDLPRSQQSAVRLLPDRAPLVLPMFRGVPLPIPQSGPGRAPFSVWEMLIHLQWIGVSVLRHGSLLEAFAQVRRAAAWCRQACHSHDADEAPVAVVTHGVLRRLLSDQLVADAWRPTSRRRTYGYWSVWAFAPPLTQSS